MGQPLDSVIQFRDVAYGTGDRLRVTDLNFTLQAGETLVLLGRSGCGKTTTLKLINGLLQPTAGELRIQGIDRAQWNLIQLRRQIGYVIQEVGLFPHFSIARNVGLVPALQGWSPRQIRQRVGELLTLVGLDPQRFAQCYPHQLSGGQRQRVGVARALAANPPILLMDEPFGALDPITRMELQREFRQLQAQLGKTVVLVTHDIQEALLLATKIGLMQAGQLIFLGTPTDFLQANHPEAQAFRACIAGSNGQAWASRGQNP